MNNEELLEDLAQQVEDLIALCQNNEWLSSSEMLESLEQMRDDLNAALGYKVEED